MAKATTKPRKTRAAKALVASEREWTHSAVRVVEGSGTKGAKSRPFNYHAAVAMYCSWAYAACSINANAVASVPLRLYVRTRNAEKLWRTRPVARARKAYLMGDGPQQPSHAVMAKSQEAMDGFEEVDSAHPLLRLLREVNEFNNGFENSVLTTLYGELTGNAFWYVARQGGLPVAIWNMPPQWTEIVPSREEFIKGYVFGASEETKRMFEPEEVIHFKYPNPSNVYYGKGKIEAGWWVLSQNQAAHEMDTALYDNHARPDYLLTIKGQAQKDQLDRFEKSVQMKLRGAKDSGKFLTVTGDVDLKPLSWPPKDLGGREEVVEEIAAVTGVPVSMLKANDPNKASAGSGYGQWREGTILPLCRMREETLNAKLLPMFGIGDDAFLAYDNPVPRDVAQEIQRWNAMAGRVLTVNEVRGEDGYPPVDDGDMLYVPAGSVPLGTEPVEVDAPKNVDAESQDSPQAGDIETTQATVLNGAQVSAATAIVVSVATGEIPRDAGIGQLEVLFNLSSEQAERLMGSSGTGTATTPNPNPASAKEGASGVGNDKPSGSMPDDDGNGRDAGKALRIRDGAVGGAHGAGRAGDAARLHDGVGGGGSEAGACGAGCACAGDRGDSDRDNAAGTPVAKSARAEWLHLKDVAPYAGYVPPDESRRKIDELARLLGIQRERLAAIIEAQGTSVTLDLLRQALADPAFLAEFNAILRPITLDALHMGAANAADKLGDIAEFNVSTNPRVEAAIVRRVEMLAEDLNRTTLSRAVRIVGDGIESGATNAEIAANIRSQSLWSDSARAENIARTESAMAYTDGQLAAWAESGVVVGSRWLLAPDACEFCVAAATEHAGRVQPLGTPFYTVGQSITTPSGSTLALDYRDIDGPPLHPQCVLPDTVVETPSCLAAMRANYNGEIVELALSNGARLSVTKHHKLLTSTGFVEACDLREGMDLLGAGSGHGIVVGDPHDYDMPSKAGDRFHAASIDSRVLASSVPVAPEHLHGDGKACDGEIDVVSVNRSLMSDLKANGAKVLGDIPLCLICGCDTLPPKSDLSSMLVALSGPAYGFVRGAGEPHSLVPVSRSHPLVHGLGSVPVRKSDGLESSDDCDSAYATLLGQALDGFSSHVLPVKIVEVNVKSYRGHVIDFTTYSGLYVAAGVISGNCRCSLVPVTESEVMP